MASILYHSAILSGVGCWTEHRYWSRSATKGSPAAGTEELAAFLLTPTILFGVGYWAVLHGFLVVGKAREKYMAQARADGEENVEERYGLPNLYAQGTSPHARAFNCVQRSHQHIFETYPLVVISGMLGAIGFPLTTALSTLSYAVGRYLISRDYARGRVIRNTGIIPPWHDPCGMVYSPIPSWP